jgi:hypothetical protein
MNNKELQQAKSIMTTFAERNKGKRIKIVGKHPHANEIATILTYQDTDIGPAIRCKDRICEFFVMQLSNLQLID